MENVTIVVPFYNGHEPLGRLLASLPSDLPVLVVDDQSDVPLVPQPHWADSVTVLPLPAKGYFAGAVNAALEALPNTTDVLVLNQDVWFSSEAWLDVLHGERERHAMIGERIAGHHPAFPHGYIHGTFLFLRRDAIDQVGPLNARDYPLWGSTAEWQWRAARRGFSILPLAEIPGFHHERPAGQAFGASITQLLARQPEQRSRLIRTPPLVSVIVPCHNYGRYLADCLASLVGGDSSLGPQPGQTLQSFEVILVDDASTDGSAQIAARLADAWQGIRVYGLEENVGTAAALNYGIERAVGQYITFLSADDMRHPDSLEALVRACETNPHHFAYDDVHLFGHGQWLRRWPMQDYDFEALLVKNHVHAGILYPKQAWIDAGGYPPQMDDGREDWAFNIALGERGWCGVHVRADGYWYRREGQNRSATNTTPDHRARFEAKIRSLFPHLYQGERPMSCCGGKRTTMSNHSKPRPPALPLGLAGAAGMVLLEYTGGQQDAVWTGHVTHTAYRFGVTKRTGWVDRRDAGDREGKGFLGMRRNGHYVFRLAAPPKRSRGDAGPQPSPAAVPVAPPAPVGEAGQAETGAVPRRETPAAMADRAENVPNPDHLTVAQIRALELDPSQWRALRASEVAGKNRKSVLAQADRVLAL